MNSGLMETKALWTPQHLAVELLLVFIPFEWLDALVEISL